MMALFFPSITSLLLVIPLTSSGIDAFHMIPSRSILHHFYGTSSSPIIIKQQPSTHHPLYASKSTANKVKQKKKNNDDVISFSFTYDINKRSVLLKCLLAIILYMICGVACYSGGIFDKWSIIDSLYFSVVTFTTVG